ncbi:MAG TPA: hypothetical protein VJ696_05960, partial [Rhodanobacteraceae bacterium]|nr:hypothetical protein [Rhodanobacteraceae bacterium]
MRKDLLAQAAEKRGRGEAAASYLDLEEAARLRLPRERRVVEPFARARDEEAIELLAAERALGDVRDGHVKHGGDAAFGIEARDARAAPMAAPDAALGVDREPVGVALVRRDAREHARTAGDAPAAQADAQDAPADRIDEIAERAVRVECGPVRDHERGLDVLAGAAAGEAEEVAGRRALGEIHRAEPERAVGMA